MSQTLTLQNISQFLSAYKSLSIAIQTQKRQFLLIIGDGGWLIEAGMVCSVGRCIYSLGPIREIVAEQIFHPLQEGHNWPRVITTR